MSNSNGVIGQNKRVRNSPKKLLLRTYLLSWRTVGGANRLGRLTLIRITALDLQLFVVRSDESFVVVQGMRGSCAYFYVYGLGTIGMLLNWREHCILVSIWNNKNFVGGLQGLLNTRTTESCHFDAESIIIIYFFFIMRTYGLLYLLLTHWRILKALKEIFLKPYSSLIFLAFWNNFSNSKSYEKFE